MNQIISSSVAVTVLLSIVGCGGGTAPDSRGTDPAWGDAPAGSTTVSLSGVVRTENGDPAASAEVCALAAGGSQCTASDAGGAWSLTDLPTDTQVVVTFEQPGFVPTLLPIRVGEAPVVVTATLMPAVESRSVMGTPADTTRGQLEFVAPDAEGATAGIAVTLTGLDGRVHAPTYLDEHGTGIAGATTGTRGGFADLADGDYLLTFTRTSATCAVTEPGFISGYLSTSPVVVRDDPTGETSTVVVPVLGGYLTGPIPLTCAASAGR